MQHLKVSLAKIVEFLKSKMECTIDLGDNLSHSTVSKVSKLDPLNDDSSVLFWINQKNLSNLSKLLTGVVIAPLQTVRPISFTGSLILCENPRRAFSLVINEFFSDEHIPLEFNDSSINSNISSESFVGYGTVIEPSVSIGRNVIIGYNNVILRGTIIGDNVRIGSNNTIGGIGFGYEKNENSEWEVIPHLGNVIIEDFVEIGNNNCIDRAVLGSTILKKKCKIDNLVHIAHGVFIGENSLIIANSMIAGSAVIGENTWIAPSTSIINGGKVGSNSMTGIGSVVIKEIEDNSLAVGLPAKKIKTI